MADLHKVSKERDRLAKERKKFKGTLIQQNLGLTQENTFQILSHFLCSKNWSGEFALFEVHTSKILD